MAENLVLIGIVLLFIAITLIVIGSLGSKNIKVGIGGFIGPIPFGWANDPKMLPWIILLTAIVAIIFLVIALKGAGLF